MTAHTCTRFDPDCFRCDLSRDEVTPSRVYYRADITPTTGESWEIRIQEYWVVDNRATFGSVPHIDDRNFARNQKAAIKKATRLIKKHRTARTYLERESFVVHEPPQEEK